MSSFRPNAMGLVLLAALVLHNVFTGRVWIWDLLSPIPAALFALVPLGFLIHGIVRRDKIAIGLAVVAVMLGWPYADVNLNALRLPATAPSTRSVTVFNWNTQYWNEDEDHAAFYEFLRAQQADIYQLQEYWPLSGTAFDSVDTIREEFPDYAVTVEDELVTMTRFPVTTPAAGDGKKYLRTDQMVDGKLVSFYNVHLPLQLGTDMPARFRERSRQLRLLLEDLETNTNPVYISGDFNSTTAMGIMRPLRRAYKDSFAVSRTLFPATWSYHRNLPLRLWRIDFNFASDGVEFLSHEDIDPRGFSDHGGQRVTIRI